MRNGGEGLTLGNERWVWSVRLKEGSGVLKRLEGVESRDLIISKTKTILYKTRLPTQFHKYILRRFYK